MPHSLLEPHLHLIPPDLGLGGVRVDTFLYGPRGVDGEPPGLDFLPGADFEGEQAGGEVEGHRGILSRRRHVPAFDLAQLGQQPLILGPLRIGQPHSRMLPARPGPQRTDLLIQLGSRPRGTTVEVGGHAFIVPIETPGNSWRSRQFPGAVRASPPSHRAAMLTLIAPGPDARGALLSGVAVEYRVAYKVLPASVGPDDYESADLEQREDAVELPAPEGGYGPAIPDVQAALRDMLDDGAEPVAIRFLN